MNTKPVNNTIPAENWATARFLLTGTAPLVISRWKLERHTTAPCPVCGSRGHGSHPKVNDLFNESRFISTDGWDGFHAAALRNSMLHAGRFLGIEMCVSKACIFVIADGRDSRDKSIPLVRIIGDPSEQLDVVRRFDGENDIAVRSAYHNWKAIARINWASSIFTTESVENLLNRAGLQIGIGETWSAGWGMFTANLIPAENPRSRKRSPRIRMSSTWGASYKHKFHSRKKHWRVLLKGMQ